MPKTPMDKMLEGADWHAVEWEHEPTGDLPYVTHQGLLDIAGIQIHCVQLNTGERLITADGLKAFCEGLGMSDDDMKQFGIDKLIGENL